MTATGAAIFNAVNRYDTAFGIRALRRISDGRRRIGMQSSMWVALT